MSQFPNADAIQQIEKIRKERGYVLDFHELWAQWEPELLEKYNAFYDFLAFAPKEMSSERRELIWIAALTAAREVRGKLHVRRGLDAGLTPEVMGAAVRLASCVELYESLRFSVDSWAIPKEGGFPEASYEGAFAALSEGLDLVTAHLAASSAMAIRRNEAGCHLHLVLAFKHGATPRQAVEAMSITFLPGGAPALMLGTEVLSSLLKKINSD